MTYYFEPSTRTAKIMENDLKILYIYEEECDVLEINEALQKAKFSFEEKMVKSKEKFEESLVEFLPDIILSEQKTASFSSLDALKILKSKGLKIPLILVSDQLPIDEVIEIVKAGASDYVRKDHPERLPVAIHSALEKHKLEKERQEYINKLESAETRFRALVEHAVDAVVILNKDGKPTYASPSIERVLGYTEEETLELSLYEVVHPDDLPLIKLRMGECMEKPGISLPTIQCRCRHKNGKWVWYEGTITNMLHDPAINGIVDNFHDITEKKSAEEELKASEKRYRSFFETSLDAILLTVTDGQILAANPAACRMFQMTEEEICKVGRDGVLVTNGAELESILEERKKNGKITGQLTFRRKNGSLFQGEISSAIFSDSNGINRTSMIIRDISERVKAEKELKVSEENYRFLFEYSASPKWIFDIKTDEILDVNETAVKTYGYTREEFLHMKTSQLKPAEELPRIAKFQQDFKNMEGLIRFGIFTQLKKDGTRIKAEVSGHKCYYKGKVCMVIDSFDVTEREQTLHQLKDSQEKLITAQSIAKLGYWKCDLSDFQIYWSDQIYNIFGVKKETFKPSIETLLASIHPDDRENFYKTRQQTLNNLQDHEAEYRIVLPDGTIKWIHENGKFIRDKDGKPVLLEGTAQDMTSQNLLELSIEESKLRYEMVSKATSDAIWDWDFIKNKAYRGEGFQKIYGHSVKENKLEDDFWESNIHPEDRERVTSSIEEAIKSTQSNWSMEYRFRRADDTYAFVLDKGFFIRDENGKALRLAGGMQDITERKELEDLLAKATKLARIGSYEYNIDNNHSMYWSEITKEIHEVETDYVLSPEKIKDFYQDGSHLEIITKAFDNAVKKGIPFDVEIPITTGKGNSRWIRVIGETEFVNGKCARVYGSVQDIDQRKKAEEALRISNKRYAIVAKATNDSIWDWDFATNRVERPDKPLESLLGYQHIGPSEVDSFWESHVHPDDWRRITESRNKLFEDLNENYWEDEYRFLKPDGSYATVYDRGYILRDNNGKAIRMIGASRDISKLKESEIKLKLLNQELEARAKELVASNQELEQFAYVASHDLQEPLRMVTNFLTQIEKKYTDLLDEKGKTYIHFAVDGAKRMRQMILDLLEFSRAGRNIDRPEEVNLNVLVKDILNLHQKQIEETKAVVEISDLPTLAIPKTGIRQVFQNLISNSLKYNQLKKGVIPQVSICAKDFETHWQFEIKDNGIGIDSQYFEKIFIIFQRLHDRSEYSGTGIGLAITRKIIENFDGKIWIESEIEKGTSFFFTLPKKLNQVN
jgi:PAS domain S-box-containing protein